MNHSSVAARFRAAVLVAAAGLLSSGCYLLQSAAGHLQLMARREPISNVLARLTTPPALRTQLKAVNEIRTFASRELGLPDNGSYRTYADVGRPYVVWNVVAAPEFAVDPKQWCYPVVGCVAYRGYFVEKRAEAFAKTQTARGFDVAVSGAAAYSTLGHFDDPILNTMVDWDDIELAGIVFHELTHQLLYVASDASFSEALAVTVEEEGVRRWLQAHGREADLQRHLESERRYREVVNLINATRDRLREAYASNADPARMRARKQALLDDLRAQFEAKKTAWGGRAPFDAWFKQDLNNAQLASVATYYACVPGLQRELTASGPDLGNFYTRVRELAKLERTRREALICS